MLDNVDRTTAAASCRLALQQIVETMAQEMFPSARTLRVGFGQKGIATTEILGHAALSAIRNRSALRNLAAFCGEADAPQNLLIRRS
jgi:hypothetical protein